MNAFCTRTFVRNVHFTVYNANLQGFGNNTSYSIFWNIKILFEFVTPRIYCENFTALTITIIELCLLQTS